MEDTLTSLSTWGYIAVAFFSFGGSLVVVAAAGFLSYIGEMNIFIALSIAMISNFLGDNFLFYLGRYHRKDIKPYFQKHKRKIALSTLIMRKYGVWAIFIQKFLYGIKTIIPLSMAISKYDFKKFVFYNIFASIFFILVIGVGSYMAGETIKELFTYFSNKTWIIPIILFILIGITWLFLEKTISKKGKK
jgi:membrane protein DedA with SNARE-associated domain